MSRYRVGVDIGGTFTDFVLIDDREQRIAVHKRLTTPNDPSVAVLEGLDQLLGEAHVPIGEVESIIHGSTLVTNAVIERKGANVGMLVTQGFLDVLDLGREQRYDLYQLDLRYPTPLVERSRRIEITERIAHDGTVTTPLDEAQVRQALRVLVEQHRIEALAVCLLQSFLNPRHEARVRAIAQEAYPDLYICTSSEVLPYAREYERWTTTTINAFTQPMVDRYLSNLERGLAARGVKGPLYLMTSSGGTLTAATARRYPVRMLESGPAAGVLMSAHHGRRLGIRDVLSYDMGGTTAKGAIIRDGEPERIYEIEVARIHEFRAGSGLPVRVPAVDMIEIGAGGGSIAEIDERGLIRVGPRSAGAAPGPACYSLGGTQATLTDANLVLGYYDPAFFLGGKMPLDRAAAERAISETIARPLGLDVARAAWGIHEIISEDVARAFRVHASEIGFDYRTGTMIAFGGSGPAHAMRIARKLRIPRVVLPVASGVMSALGMLVSPLSFQLARSNAVLLETLDAGTFADNFQQLQDEAYAVLRDAGVPRDEVRVVRRLDLRYFGQGYEIELTLPADRPLESLLPELPAMFSRRYAEVFSLSYLQEPVEAVNWKIEVWGPAPRTSDYILTGGELGASARKGSRPAYFPETDGYVECPVYDRYALRRGESITGPALVEERESTCVVGVGDVVQLDERGNLVARINTDEQR